MIRPHRSGFRIFAIVGMLCLLLAGGAFAWRFPWALDNEAQPGVAGPIIPVVSTNGEGTIGAGAYARTCGYCHDQGIGPALRGREFDQSSLIPIVRNGLGAMPAFRESEVSDGEIGDIALALTRSRQPQSMAKPR
jgi:mono/diheme cytochrome c family protein